MIGNTAHTQGFAGQITANRGEISVHARPHGSIEPRLAILRAKDNVNDDFAERLGHNAKDESKRRGNESRFQRLHFEWHQSPGAMPQAGMNGRLWR